MTQGNGVYSRSPMNTYGLSSSLMDSAPSPRTPASEFNPSLNNTPLTIPASISSPNLSHATAKRLSQSHVTPQPLVQSQLQNSIPAQIQSPTPLSQAQAQIPLSKPTTAQNPPISSTSPVVHAPLNTPAIILAQEKILSFQHQQLQEKNNFSSDLNSSSARPSSQEGTTRAMKPYPSVNFSKLPLIPDTLTMAEPLTAPPIHSRPTLSNGTSLSAPVLTTPSSVGPESFEMGGSKVLGKRKLKDLVRNVVGSDQDNTIDGDVEEFLCDVADEFIARVTSFACRLAKHRKAETIESSDVQMHLQNNWNIRIPGYSADAVRSIRRIAPTPSYNQKLAGVRMNKSYDDSESMKIKMDLKGKSQ